MFINHNEYEMMFTAEEKLWWYRFLHQKVLKSLRNRYGNDTSISILDAGCGTGGLMMFLGKHGYKNMVGFDYSASAVQFSQNRGLPVTQLNIDDVFEKFVNRQFDVIICDDVIYALEVPQIKGVFKNVDKLLKPNGIFITNNNAFDMFRGTHDIAVGSKHRFTRSNLKKYYQPTGLKLHQSTYWSLVLSPLILAVRMFQQLQIKFNLIKESKLVSDVSVPPSLINEALYKLVKLEEKLIKKSPFGSSLFMVFKK